MKKIITLLFCVLTMGLMSGCGSFDAAKYVQGTLDNSYKNDSSILVDMKIATAEEAAEVYEEGLDLEIDAMGLDLTEEQRAEYREAVSEILKSAKYTVGEAEKQDDGSYAVSITYEKMNVFTLATEAYATMMDEKVNEWTSAAEAGETVPSEAEMEEEIMMMLKDCLMDACANATYEAAETTTIRVELVNRLYTINEEDAANLELLRFDADM